MGVSAEMDAASTGRRRTQAGRLCAGRRPHPRDDLRRADARRGRRRLPAGHAALRLQFRPALAGGTGDLVLLLGGLSRHGPRHRTRCAYRHRHRPAPAVAPQSGGARLLQSRRRRRVELHARHPRLRIRLARHRRFAGAAVADEVLLPRGACRRRSQPVLPAVAEARTQPRLRRLGRGRGLRDLPRRSALRRRSSTARAAAPSCSISSGWC